MGVYYSSTGNGEIWETKPSGYFTEEEWFSLHPLPEPKPEPEPESVPKDFETVRQDRIQELFDKYEKAFVMATSMYPNMEREGWFLQREEAAKVLAGQPSELLNEWVLRRGNNETPEEFAESIMYNFNLWSRLYSVLTFEQQRMFKEINKKQTVQELMDYEISFIPYLLEFGGTP